MINKSGFGQNLLGGVVLALAVLAPMNRSVAQTWTNALDDEALYLNQDPTIETRRSPHFRVCFGHNNWDSYAMTEQLAQGNLQMFEQCRNRWVNDDGLWDCGQSANFSSATNYRFNFNFLMTFSLTQGGGSYNSEDGNGFFYAMGNPAYCRFDPKSGATPHEVGDAWCGYGKGVAFSGYGNLWECTGNWMMLRSLVVYPQAGDYEQNGMYTPLHGRDYFGSWPIMELAMETPGFGSAWINHLYTNAPPANDYWISQMLSIPNTTGLADATNAVFDLWGNLGKRLVTWDFQKQVWLATVNGSIGGGPTLPKLGYGADSGADWVSYQRARTTLLPMPGTNGWYRCAYEDAPMEFGYNVIPLTATPGATVTCNFQPVCDPIRQSGWRACLVAVSTNVVSIGQYNTNGYASYSTLWSCGANSITLSADQTKLYLVVTATPKPQPIYGSSSFANAYLTEAGLQFPYTVSFSNAAPLNVVYAQTNGYVWKSYTNPDGTVCHYIASTATVTAPAYVGTNAMVLDSAQVYGNAQVLDYAVVGGNAKVYGNAIVSGHGLVANYAQVYGFGKVRDWAEVFGYAQVYGDGKVIEHANCGDGTASAYSTVSGSSIIKGTTYDYAGTYTAGSVIMDGDSADGGDEPLVHTNGVHFGWGWPGIGSPFNSYSNPNNWQYCGLTFENLPNSTSPTTSGFSYNGCFATDEFGINHGFLLNGCRPTIDSGTSNRGGYVLALNGTNQYVELHNSVNDFNDTTIAVWFKNTGGASGQQVWSMGNGSNKVMCLTPNDSTTGNLRFLITDGTTTNYLNGSAVPTNVWTHVAVVFAQAASNSVLYVNGLPVATNLNITLFPDSLNAPLMANANYLGRGNGGNYFQGSVDDFRVFMRSYAASDVAALYALPAPAAISPVTDSTLSTPVWLAQPYALGDSVITMSVVPGSDTSGWVQYYFSNNTVLGHDSGWVSFNNYTDCGLAPGTAYTYTVLMRNFNGVTTSASSAASATTLTSSAGTASFAYGPVGYYSGQITMTATTVTNVSGKTEYSFTCTSGGGHSSGWIASPSWTDTGLTTGASYSYTVTVRDGRGNSSAASAAVPAKAEDDAAPQLYSNPEFQWGMTPYPTITNSISMTAQAPGDPSGMRYYFHCTSSNAPDSGWQNSPTYVTPVLTNGTYSFVYMLRDITAQLNQSGYSAATYPAVITPTTGYEPCTFGQLATLSNDDLVTFTGVVTGVNPASYTVQDPNGSSTVTVGTTNFGSATTSGLLFHTVSVSGHLYAFTNMPGRSVTFSTVQSVGVPTNSISGKVTNSSGAPLAGVTIYISDTPNASTNPITTVVTAANGTYSVNIINGAWYVCAGSIAYGNSADQVVTVNSANVVNVNFGLTPNPTVSGLVTDNLGNPISGASVYFSLTPYAEANPLYVATTTAAGLYTQAVQSATLYICAGKSNYLTSADQIVTVTNNVASLDFALSSFSLNGNVPQTSQLLFSVVTDPLPASGTIMSWPTYLPAGQVLTNMATPPVVQTVGNRKWELNTNSNDNMMGLLQGTYSAPIPCSGASIVAAVIPHRNGIHDAFNSIVSLFYDRLVVGIYNNTGQLVLKVNGNASIPTGAIPDGQMTVLSMVVQPNGQYAAWTNGVLFYTNSTISTLTNLVPSVAGSYADTINLGNDGPDGWSTYSGNIGDVFVYTNALAASDRQQLEHYLLTWFGTNGTQTITATAAAGGGITPNGTVAVLSGSNQTFTVAANPAGWNINNVVVDGVSQGAVSSYIFTNVATNHTIAATFLFNGQMITATAVAGGAITPSGTVLVPAGSNQNFTISASTGYGISNVVVDGVSQGAISSYIFTNVLTTHSISATFSNIILTIAASAGSGGTISPSGNVLVNYGVTSTFAITPLGGNGINNVVVDGVSQGSISSYTFTNVTSNHTLSATFVIVPPPVVDNAVGATNLAPGMAQLWGSLNNGPADVRVYWGSSDGGTNGPWANTNLLTAMASGSFSTNVSGLLYGLNYYYRVYASNAVGTAWAPATATFNTLRPMGLAAGMIPFSNMVEVAASEELAGGGYEVVNAFNGNGLSGDGITHGTAAGFWVSNGGATSNQWVRVHFNSAYPLDYLRIWNYNETGFEAESLKSADVYELNSDVDPGNNLQTNATAFNATGWTRVLPNQLFVKAPGGSETNTDPHISLGGATARQLALKVNANYSVPSDVWVGLSQVQIYNLAIPAISLTNSGATSITNNAASLNGVLTCNGAVYDVYACWNTTNGGTNAAAWVNSAHVGTWTNLASANLSFTATGLTPNTSYYYTFLATNALETMWATNVQNFTTIMGPTPPVLSAANLTLPGGVPTFAISNTLLGYQYTLVYKNNLTDSVWIPLTGSGTAAGTGGTINLSDTNSIYSSAQRFYRLQLQ